MTLVLSDAEVQTIFTPSVAYNAMLQCFQSQAKQEAASAPRLQLDTSMGWLRIQAGLSPTKGYVGFKAYNLTKGVGPRYAVFLYRISSGELCAIIDADALTVQRTGALSGVASKYLSKQNAHTLGVLGSSRQARSLVQSILLVRKLERVKVYSPNPAHRNSFAAMLNSEFGVSCIPVETPKEAVLDQEIVGTATGNKTTIPILDGEWLADGAHVNAIGAVGRGRVELDERAFSRASSIVIDSEECLESSEELINALKAHVAEPGRIVNLGKVVGGEAKGRSSDEEITIFKSQGSGVQDVFAAAATFELAQKEGLGRVIGEIGPALRR